MTGSPVERLRRRLRPRWEGMREVATDCQLSVYAAKRAFRALEAAGQAERREFVEAGELVVQWRVPPHR